MTKSSNKNEGFEQRQGYPLSNGKTHDLVTFLLGKFVPFAGVICDGARILFIIVEKDLTKKLQLFSLIVPKR